MDEKMTAIGDWMTPPDPSPRTLMSSFLSQEFCPKPFPDLFADNVTARPVNLEDECSHDGFNFSNGGTLLEPSSFDGQKSNSRGGLAQRIARAGFNAPTINTAHIKSANMATSSASDVRSPYLTIPPGLSPTTLLDSPVFLSNSMVQPSPTTGKISFLNTGGSSLSIPAVDLTVPDSNKDDHPEDIGSGGFAFKPHLDSTSANFSIVGNEGSFATERRRSLQSVDRGLQKDFDLPAGVSESSDRADNGDDSTICPRPTDSFVSNEHSPPLEDQPDGGDSKEELSCMSVAALAEDGYNWRKYGQKQVKGSEFPRSYYKCTHPTCQVKKKVERSHEGHITEIIYKGAHNHAKPPATRRSGILPANPFNEARVDGLDHPGSQANCDGRPQWAGDGMDATSSASVVADFANPSTSVQTQDGSHLGSPEAIDVSSTVSNEEEEDQATHASVSLGVDGEEDESESKRRKLDACAVEMNTGSRAVREPRVVVQTTSEVDILDDGYRWRKYGQKVVKGNPNPRSYYKCTNPGCTVRKHVERASHDLKSVITTYEGKHNHDVPAARNSSHSSSGPSTASASAAQSQALHRRPDPAQDDLMHFNGPPPFNSFNLSGRDPKLGMGPSFSFGMGQLGLADIGLGGLGLMGQLKMPVLGPVHSYVGQQAGNASTGFMVPKGEPEEELVSEAGLPVSNAMVAAYHHLLSRLPLGPQL